MQLPRVRFTMRWMMVAVILVGLALAVIVHRERQRYTTTLKAAESAHQAAGLALAVAKMALKDYREGVLKAELHRIDDTIVLCKAERSRAEEKLGWTLQWSDGPSPDRYRRLIINAEFEEE